MSFQLRRLSGDERAEVLALHPVPEPHAPDLAACEAWGAFQGGLMLGFVAFREGWIDRLYVRPERTRAGVGPALLTVAKESWPRLSVWTVQHRGVARFWEDRGFHAVEVAPGEGEPLVRYRWAEED